MYLELAVLAAFLLLYSSVAGGVERTWVSGPIVFTVFGLLVGPLGFNLLSIEVEADTIRTLAELTLALVLFTDAAAADLGVLRKTWGLPTRLLLLGLPLTILLGFGIGLIFFQELSVFEVALLATMLAPTDAALEGGHHQSGRTQHCSTRSQCGEWSQRWDLRPDSVRVPRTGPGSQR
jgi:NhaP-type Na+/H+ or K+/H+ antiporter